MWYNCSYSGDRGAGSFTDSIKSRVDARTPPTHPPTPFTPTPIRSRGGGAWQLYTGEADLRGAGLGGQTAGPDPVHPGPRGTRNTAQTQTHTRVKVSRGSGAGRGRGRGRGVCVHARTHEGSTVSWRAKVWCSRWAVGCDGHQTQCMNEKCKKGGEWFGLYKVETQIPRGRAHTLGDSWMVQYGKPS